MDVYMGLAGEEFELITPTGEQTRELHQLDFRTYIGPDGWHAIWESGRYRVQVVPHRRGWQVSNTRTSDGVVQMVRYRAELGDAVGLVMDTALDVELVHALSDLIVSELRRAA